MKSKIRKPEPIFEIGDRVRLKPNQPIAGTVINKRWNHKPWSPNRWSYRVNWDTINMKMYYEDEVLERINA